MSTHVAVLMGGWSAEREISLVSGDTVGAALRDAGYRVTMIDVGRDADRLLASLRPRPDVIFNTLHGRFGEDGCIQGVLELLGIPYTHSGILASALAMEKPTAKELFIAAGIPCAEGVVVNRDAVLANDVMERPYVIKPIHEGSSVGVHMVFGGDNRKPLDEGDWPYGDKVLVERYVPGREITVAVMGERALGALEIRPKDGFFDYSAKYTKGKAERLMPAPLVAEAYEEVLELAVLAHRTLGCRGVTRADLRYDDSAGEPGRFYMLELNTQPGMTPLSMVPEIAAHAGVSFQELVTWMVENAECEC
ncbi:MAG: D-alanine--D-alanine ligase [Alphaproteobacteria bacterium]